MLSDNMYEGDFNTIETLDVDPEIEVDRDDADPDIEPNELTLLVSCPLPSRLR